MTVSLAPRVRQAHTQELAALAERGNIELGSLTDHEASPARSSRGSRSIRDGCRGRRLLDGRRRASAPRGRAAAQGVDVLFLDTGYHFAETRFTRDEVERVLDVRIVDVLPEQTVAEQDAEFGAQLFARDPALCCARRKVAPLQDALAGYEVWFTGVRREESPTRTNTPLVVWDERNGLVKVNPVAAWTFDDLLDYAGEHKVPVNLLVSNGYPSIGCEPCTKPVAPGEDPRSGRWAGLSKRNADCTNDRHHRPRARTTSTLDLLEAEAIHIIREVVAEFERPVLLFSGGKDSVVVLHLATKAFFPGKVPFPVLTSTRATTSPRSSRSATRRWRGWVCGSRSRTCRTTSTTAACRSAPTAPATRCRRFRSSMPSRPAATTPSSAERDAMRTRRARRSASSRSATSSASGIRATSA